MLKKAIEELVASGLSEADIADRVDTSQPTINRIRNEKQNASFDLGRRILALRDKRVAKEAAA
jgi:transcriptional regulator with XRE-family HTH domain